MTYIDLRPRWLLILGFVLICAAVIAGGLGAVADMTVVLNSVKAKYLATYQEPMNVGRYLWQCSSKASCMETYLAAWQAPAWLRAVHLTNLVAGVLFVFYGRIWKPETLYRRQVRVASARTDVAKDHSMKQPKGTLQRMALK
ncbi:hypothetical protein [Deinococcus xianganensis]|uniref:Uncharacterized protein n=1 Tax=Deinococcus xianganensis TaxID=1507289 RepID=A0A6I4YS31_9DEIO|nr:hypothetical protein [Deinococcus xianganensis]MXV21787.1 hypothetical protein [Deinococcus xianganensis]